MALRKFLFMSSEGYAEEQAATDEIALSKLTLSGSAGVSLDGGAARATNFIDPTAATDLATKQYVDAAAVGIDWKPSVRAATTANVTVAGGAPNTLDGVTLVLNDRILVKDQSSGAENGLYFVSTLGTGANGTWTRTLDSNISAEVTSGLAVFVTEGTIAGDTGWVLTTNDPIVLATTALVFTQFTGSGTITGGSGILKTGSQLDVELDTAAAAQTGGNGGGSSGLEFDTAGVGGKLRAAVVSGGGLERAATGLQIRLNGTTLQSSSSGASVKGLPSLFEVNAVATTAGVTAANLNILTDVSNADALHLHSAVSLTRTASGAIAKGDAVYYSGNDVVSTGDCTVDAESRIIGVANAAISGAASGVIKTQGVVTGILTGATAGTKYYMSNTGAPVVIGSLAAGNRVIQVGIAKNTTDLEVQIIDYGKKAA